LDATQRLSKAGNFKLCKRQQQWARYMNYMGSTAATVQHHCNTVLAWSGYHCVLKTTTKAFGSGTHQGSMEAALLGAPRLLVLLSPLLLLLAVS
jgi:hypothetical protein